MGRTNKISYGIALCRYGELSPEIIMIKKRYTYYYFSFVFGRYSKNNTRHLTYLFDNMTFTEKLEILRMDYRSMWYRIWLYDPEKNYIYSKNRPNRKLYYRKKALFEASFMRDGGSRLKKLISRSKHAQTPWEMPKGGKEADEEPVTCAIREFEEETGISSEKYTIMWDAPITSSHTEDGVTYKSIYYVAYLNRGKTCDTYVSFKSLKQIAEVEQIKWLSRHDLVSIDLQQDVKNRLCILHEKAIKMFKSRIKKRYYLD